MNLNFNIKKSDDSPFFYGKKFFNYQAGQSSPGWDFAAYLRYQNEDNFYKILISARRNEIALWKPTGGFLQIRLSEITGNKNYYLKASVKNNTVEVYLNNKLELSYTDNVLPVKSGDCGIGAYENAKIIVNDIKIENNGENNLDDSSEKIHTPYFYTKQWREFLWIFDGNEPIAYFDKERLMVFEAKLKPGYKPLAYWELFWKQYLNNDLYADKLDGEIIVEKEGSELIMRWQSQTKDRAITSRQKMKLYFDNNSQTYAYDINTEMEVNENKAWPYYPGIGRGLEYLELMPYNAVPPAGQIKNPWQSPYKWVIFQNEEDVFSRQPLNHNFTEGQFHSTAYVKSPYGIYGYFQGETITPAIKLLNPPDKFLKGYTEFCNAGFDSHFRYLLNEQEVALQGGTKYYAHYQILGINSKEAKEISDKSSLDPLYASNDSEFPIYKTDLNDFATGRKKSEPHSEWSWKGNYIWDKTTGYDDTYSLKFSGPGEALVDSAGNSYFTMLSNRPAGDYIISAYIKTDSIKNGYPEIGIWSKHPEEQPNFFAITDATNEWKKFEFIKKLPQNSGIKIALKFNGEGSVWFDNVKIENTPSFFQLLNCSVESLQRKLCPKYFDIKF